MSRIESLCLGAALLAVWSSSLRAGGVLVVRSLNAPSGLLAGDLVKAGLLLAAMNSIRALMLYWGWLSLGEAFPGGIRGWVGSAVILAGIPLSYGLSWAVTGGSGLHFGTGAVVSLSSVLLVRYLTGPLRGTLDRVAVMGLVVLSLQWLDLCPSLTSYGFGGGELSMAVKGLASAMGEEALFDWIGFLGFALSLTGALSGASILMGKVLQERQFRLIRSQERMLAQMREEGRRARVFREIQHLVHDLRRPLTVITGLVDVLLSESPSDRRLRLVMEAAEGMNRMIQEILSGEASREVTVREVVDLCLSQLSPMPYRERVEESLPEDVAGTVIRANVMRLSRALANLVDNGARWGGTVTLSCRRVPGGVEFLVRDRGPGFSGGSFGTGLTFVEDTAASHGGAVEIRNPGDGGCEVSLLVLNEQEVVPG